MIRWKKRVIMWTGYPPSFSAKIGAFDVYLNSTDTGYTLFTQGLSTTIRTKSPAAAKARALALLQAHFERQKKLYTEALKEIRR